MNVRTIGMVEFAVAALAAGPLAGQVNIERFRPAGEDIGVSGEVRFDLSARTGNVELVELGAEGRVDHVGQATRTFAIARGDLGWQGGERFANEALLHLRHVRRITATFRIEAFAQVNYDKSRLLLFRGLVGGGVRLGLYRAERARVWFGSAYMFERERLDLPVGAVHPPQTSSHRWSSYLSTSVGFGGGATLLSTVYVQPRIDDFSDVRVLGELGIGAELFGEVSLTVSFRLRYDGDPPDAIKALDTALSSGLAIGF